MLRQNSSPLRATRKPRHRDRQEGHRERGEKGQQSCRAARLSRRFPSFLRTREGRPSAALSCLPASCLLLPLSSSAWSFHCVSLALIQKLAITLLDPMQVTKKFLKPPKLIKKTHNPLHLQMVGLQKEGESEREIHLGLRSLLPCTQGRILSSLQIWSP